LHPALANLDIDFLRVAEQIPYLQKAKECVFCPWESAFG
jgi:hypothetical protein